MGNWGWFHWLGEEIDKLKALREITKDEAQLKIIDELIAENEKKLKKD